MFSPIQTKHRFVHKKHFYKLCMLKLKQTSNTRELVNWKRKGNSYVLQFSSDLPKISIGKWEL